MNPNRGAIPFYADPFKALGGAHAGGHHDEADRLAERIRGASVAVDTLTAWLSRTTDPSEKVRLRGEIRRATAALASYRKALEAISPTGASVPAAENRTTAG